MVMILRNKKAGKWRVLGLFFIFLGALISLFPGISTAQFNQQFEIEKHHLAGENFFDWKAYQMPTAWRYQWRFTENGFNTTIGSLSQDQFFFKQELRFHTSLTPSISFSYHQYREEFYREDPLYQEVGFRYGTDYGVSLMGFPTHEKRGNSAGAALLYGKAFSTHYIKLSRLLQNFMYNEKNTGDEKNSVTDEYSEAPVMDQIEIQYLWDNRVFLAAKLDYEHQAILKANDGSSEKRYSGHNYEVELSWMFRDANRVGFQYRDDLEHRRHVDKSGGGESISKEQTLSYEMMDLFYFYQNETDDITFGYLFSHFKNRINAIVLTDTYDFYLGSSQVYIFWRTYQGVNSRLNYGLQAGTFKLQKENSGEVVKGEEGTQLKFTFGFEFFKKGDYRLLGNSTWDLDTFLGRQWDGGNIQLHVYF